MLLITVVVMAMQRPRSRHSLGALAGDVEVAGLENHTTCVD